MSTWLIVSRFPLAATLPAALPYLIQTESIRGVQYHSINARQEKPAGRRPGPIPAHSPDEIRQIMVDLGQQHLERAGVSIGMDSVHFDEVAREAEIPRASAYRAWDDAHESGGQQSRLRHAVAKKVLIEQMGFGEQPGGAFDDTMNAVFGFLPNVPDLTALDARQRWTWLREIMRLGGNANQRSGTMSQLFPAYVALAAGVASRDAGRSDPLWQAWHEGERLSRQRFVEFYQTFADTFGLRLRAGLAWEHFGTITAALAEGIVLRAPANSALIDHIELDTEHQSDDTGWSLYSIGFVALIQGFFEPDPDAEQSVDWTDADSSATRSHD